MRPIDADRLKMHYSWWNNEEKEVFDQIIDLQPTVGEVFVWVRTEDRTPDPYVNVLGTYEIKCGKRAVEMMWIDAEGGWHGVNDEYRITHNPIEPIAWTPIPSPYSGPDNRKTE